MTPQEQQMLKGLTDRINQTVLEDKDPEAEQFLSQSLSRNPDSVYILAQTVLVQQYALDQAKKQLDEAKQQLQQAQQPVKHTSFLGSLLGTDEPRQPAPPPPQQYNQAQYQPVPNYPNSSPQQQYGQPQYAQPPYAQPQYGAPQGNSFLGSALRTAGGVAAGALAFEGIESLMHGFGHNSGSGSGFGNFGGADQPREEVVNNYYDGERPGQQGISRDIEDRRDDNGRDNFANASDNSQFDDNTAADNTDYGSDSGSDDSGGSFGSDDNS
jgi:hypothetical protein